MSLSFHNRKVYWHTLCDGVLYTHAMLPSVTPLPCLEMLFFVSGQVGLSRGYSNLTQIMQEGLCSLLRWWSYLSVINILL